MITNVVYILINAVLLGIYFIVLPYFPLMIRVPIDVLVGLYLFIWLTAYGCTRYGNFKGSLLGYSFFLIFIWGRLVTYEIIDPLFSN